MMQTKTFLLTYQYDDRGRNQEKHTCIPTEFGLVSEETGEKQAKTILDFIKDDEKRDSLAHFMSLIEKETFTGSEIMMMAFMGWKDQMDRMNRTMSQGIGGLLGLLGGL